VILQSLSSQAQGSKVLPNVWYTSQIRGYMCGCPAMLFKIGKPSQHLITE